MTYANKIIDFRLRPPARGFLNSKIYSAPDNRNRYTQKLGWPQVPSANMQSLDLLKEEMRAAGIAQGVVVGRTTATLGSIENRDVADIVAQDPEIFIGVGSADTSNRRLAFKMIDEAIGLGLRAVNLEPGVSHLPMRADDRRLYPIYAKCEDAGLPIIIMAGGGAGPDLTFTWPHAIDRMLADFPDLKVACSHGGWPWAQEILGVAFRRSNLYLCPDMYLGKLPGTADYFEAANGFLSERMLFGTAYPFCPLKPYVDWFMSHSFSDEALERVLFKNAREFLNLPT